MHRSSFLAAAVGALLLATAGLPAAEQSPAEAKLREALKNTMLQLRSTMTERDALQAAKTEADGKIDDLTKKVETLTKELGAERQASEKDIAELKSKVADHEATIAHFKEDLAKTQAELKQAIDFGQSKEAARAKLALDVIELQRKVADREAKNRELFQIGSEILSRYEKFGLGTALTAREPFTGITRVKLRTLVQDYSDKLADQKIKAEPAKPSGSPASAQAKR